MKKSIIHFISYILYIVFLMLCFDRYLTKAYDYYGFVNNMNMTSLLISILILMLTYGYIYKIKTNTYSKFILYILILVNFIPNIVTFSFIPKSYKYLVLLLTYWGSLILFITILNKFKVKYNTKTFNGNLFILYLVLIVEILIVSFIILRYTGLTLNFKNVYILRYRFNSIKIPIILLYLFATFKIINPILFVVFYMKNKKTGFVLSLFVQMLLFLCDGSKSTIFSIILVYGISILMKKNKINNNFLDNANLKYYILYALLGINILGFVDMIIFKKAIIYNYFIRRMMFIPSLLNQYYYNFFSINEFDYFKQSIIGRFGVESTYTRPIQNIIGELYFNDPTMLANNGLFSDAYINLGTIGMLIMPLLIAIILRFLDFSAKGVKQNYLVTVLITITFILISSSFFTVLLTHGYIATCLVILFFIPKEQKEEKNEKT